MAHQPHVCPWWLGYFLISPIRRMFLDPEQILAAHVAPGMTVLEPGPGMGFFTLPLARRVGSSGRVITLDVQAKMIDRLKRRAAKAGLAERIDARVVQPHSMGLDNLAGAIDFVLAFAVVHELPVPGDFFREASLAMKPGARMLLAEPMGQVRAGDFDAELASASRSGLGELPGPPIVRRARTALLEKAIL